MGARPVDLGEFIRGEGTTILRRWEARVRGMSVAHDRSRATLLDHFPELLEAVACSADSESATPAERAAESARYHAAGRLEEGYDLAEVVAEYIELRACIFERLEELGLFISPSQSRKLNRAIDHALRDAADRFTSTNQKMLRALDRIAGKHTGPRSVVDDVLNDILHAMRETAAAEVDSIALLLLGDDGRLRLRASIGFEEELKAGVSVAVGEGFAGAIAQTAAPKTLRDAANDPIAAGGTLRQRGTRALYGVPLLDDGRVIGVAHMGSCNAYQFSEEDLILFRAVAERATSVILRAQLLETLERNARFREQFIAVLGHDLRDPINAALGTVRLLRTADSMPPDRLARALARVERSLTRMNYLIADILDFTRTRLGGGFPVKVSRVCLSELTREVADEHALTASNRRLEIDADGHIMGEWDRERLAQMLANLLMNAIQHSPDGARVRVAARRESSCAVLEVWNEGRPIPPGTKLFEPFERGATSNGLGLGLYIAHEIARAHGGTLSVRSDTSGTTFTAWLPLPSAA